MKKELKLPIIAVYTGGGNDDGGDQKLNDAFSNMEVGKGYRLSIVVKDDDKDYATSQTDFILISEGEIMVTSTVGITDVSVVHDFMLGGEAGAYDFAVVTLVEIPYPLKYGWTGNAVKEYEDMNALIDQLVGVSSATGDYELLGVTEYTPTMGMIQLNYSGFGVTRSVYFDFENEKIYTDETVMEEVKTLMSGGIRNFIQTLTYGTPDDALAGDNDPVFGGVYLVD